MSAWIPVVGTLGGAALGLIAAIVLPRTQWKLQQSVRWDAVRAEAYARFLGNANAYFLALCDVARAIRVTKDVSKVRREYGEAELLKPVIVSVKGEVDLLAGASTRQAADRLREYLRSLNASLYHGLKALAENGPVHGIKETAEYDADYAEVQARFVSAVNAELRISAAPEDRNAVRRLVRAMVEAGVVQRRSGDARSAEEAGNRVGVRRARS